MNHAIKIHETGGPEVMKWENVETPVPSADEVLIRQSHIGLNYIDTYFRTGLYDAPLPLIPGMEAAGVIEETGANVTNFKPGDRVAYATAPIGAYTQMRAMPAERIIKLPDDISEETAAAALVQGMTAEYLLHRTYPVQAGETILFHAAAGGVGLIACQWANALGATVIGTVGSAEKAKLARANGCAHVINYNEENFVERVREITNGQGVPVVYDSVGQATFEGSLDCLMPRGMMVSFGNASGPVTPIEPLLLAQKGSIFLTRPTSMAYNSAPEDYQASAAKLFEAIRAGHINIAINQRYELKDATRAHTDLEARKTTGSSVFTV